MTIPLHVRAKPAFTPTPAPAGAASLVQRKCACGGSAGLSGECEECRKKKVSGGEGVRLQPKLAIAAPGDRYKQEADRVAGQVTSDQWNGEEDGGVGVLRTPDHGVSPAEACDVPQEVHGVLQSAGRGLDAASRSFFEPRFGHDFSRIRVHDDGRAADSARAVAARAYTVGHHIVFDAGEYAPTTAVGRRLLAHELTHSVQQGAASPRPDTLGGGPVPSITHAAGQQLSRWKIEGTEASAEKDGESLERLARRVGAGAESWRCIRPIEMALADGADRPADFNERYARYVTAADRFDLSDLLASTGPSVRIHILSSATEQEGIGLFERMYPGLTHYRDPDLGFRQESNRGLTPIKQLVLVGHADEYVMMANPDGKDKFSPRAAVQYSPDLPLDLRLDGNRDQHARGPGWPRDAAAAVLVHARRVHPRRGLPLDRVRYRLRQHLPPQRRHGPGHHRRRARQLPASADARRTEAETERLDEAEPPCTTYGSLEFTDDDGIRLDGPFYNVADFHAGSRWATVAYRGEAGWSEVKSGQGSRPRRVRPDHR